MNTATVQQPTLPMYFPMKIVVRRLTCRGMQYSIMDTNGAHTAIEVVTLANGVARCTCGQPGCGHVQVVMKQEEVYKIESAQREAFVTAYSIY